MKESQAPFDLPALGAWWWRLRHSALRIARLANDRSARVQGAVQILGNILANEDLVVLLGGPPSRLDVMGLKYCQYKEWLEAVWGRRCSHYLSMLARGLLLSCEVYADEEAAQLANGIKQSSRALMTQFSRERPGVSLESALRFRITPFLTTYLDATLFSCLVLLERTEDPESPNYADLRISDITKVKEGLLEIIRGETALYLDYPRALMDVSTLWWAVSELVLRDGDRFAVGKYQKRGGVVDLCVDLASQTLTEPTLGMALSEATAEIHRPFRTRSLVVQNALTILEMQWSESEFARLSAPLMKLVNTLLRQVEHYPPEDAPRPNEEEEHAYFSGLGLETATRCLLHVRSRGIQFDVSRMAPRQLDDAEWSPVWSTRSELAKAYGYKDYRPFVAALEANNALRKHPKNRQKVKVKLSVAEALRREVTKKHVSADSGKTPT